MNIKNDIYISCHKHTGIRYARILQFELDKRGYSVFLDDNSGFLGDKLKQIIRDTRIFMIILSEDYLEHCSIETNWTRQEIMLALNSKRDIIIVNPDNSFAGVPTKIPNEISTFIRNSQWLSIPFGTKLSHSIDILVSQYISPIVGNSQDKDNMKQGKEYFAFISYKREDEKWAKWLQHKLEHYHLPTNVRRDHPALPQSIRPVFKDTSELAAGVLADEIQEALENSKYLIVICSPRAAQSKWVGKEVQTFIDMGRSDRIIPFIVGGIPFSEIPEEECFPSSLLNLPKEQELLGVNINEMGRDAATVKVVARMFDLKFDTLWQRYEREQKRKRWMWIGGMLLFALASLGIGAYIAQKNIALDKANAGLASANKEIKAERDRANTEKDRAERTSDSLRIAFDSIIRQKTLIQQQRNDLDLSNKKLQLSNEQLANEKQAVLTQYAKLVAARAEERIKDNDYLTARRMLLEVLPQKGGDNSFPYIPEVEQVLRESFENNSCVINAHTNSVSDLAISPNGQYIVSCANEEDIKIWDRTTGLLYGSIPNNKSFTSIMFSPSGLLYISSDSTWVWNLAPLRKIVSFKGTNIKDIDDKNRILSVIRLSNHQNIVITDGMTGKQLTTFPVSSNSKLMTSAIFLPDNRIATASLNDSILIWDINTKSLIKGWRAHTYGVNFIHKSNNGEYLLSGEYGKISFQDGLISNDSLTTWDTQTGDIISKYPYHVNDALFSPDNKCIITRTKNDVVIIDVSTGKKIKTLSGHKSNITNINTDKRGRIIVSASSDGIIRLWDEKAAEPTTPKRASTSNYSIPVAIHPNGNSFLISTGDSMMAFSTNPYKEIKKFGKKIPFKISSIRYNKDGNNFITADANATLWRSYDYTPISTIRSFRPVYAEISPDGSKALTVQGGNAICIWDISKGDSVVSKHLAAFKSGISSNRVNMASFSPDGKHIVTANSDGTIRIWDVNKQICIDSLIGHKGSINTAFYNPQGNYIVSASSDKTIRIWNTKTHRSTIQIGHLKEVLFAEFSSDGKYVISTSIDNVCKIWDAKTGIALQTDYSNNSWSAMNNNKGIYVITDYPNGVTLKPFHSYQSIIDRVKKLFSR